MDEPPLKLAILGIILLVGIVVPSLTKNAPQWRLEADNTPLNGEFAVIQGNSVVGTIILYIPNVYTLGTLIEEKTEKMDRIMDAESNDNPFAKNPISSAWGRCQMMKGTRDYVEKKWGLKIDWNDPEQQGYACERLLREEGDSHWLESKEVWSNKRSVSDN